MAAHVRARNHVNVALADLFGYSTRNSANNLLGLQRKVEVGVDLSGIQVGALQVTYGISRRAGPTLVAVEHRIPVSPGTFPERKGDNNQTRLSSITAHNKPLLFWFEAEGLRVQPAGCLGGAGRG